MNDQGTIIEIGSYRWPRHIAIHEAGHAIAAWFFGTEQVEIALANEQRIAKTYTCGDVDDCKAVAVWATNHPQKLDEIKPHDLATDEAKAKLIGQVCKDMISSLAGIVAQSRYTGDDVNALMKTSGKQDMQNVCDLVEVYRAAGGGDKNIRQTSLSRTQALISLKWWDVIALAKILENRNHMPASNFQAIMGNIDKPIPSPLTLAELDMLAGGE